MDVGFPWVTIEEGSTVRVCKEKRDKAHQFQGGSGRQLGKNLNDSGGF